MYSTLKTELDINHLFLCKTECYLILEHTQLVFVIHERQVVIFSQLNRDLRLA